MLRLLIAVLLAPLRFAALLLRLRRVARGPRRPLRVLRRVQRALR